MVKIILFIRLVDILAINIMINLMYDHGHLGMHSSVDPLNLKSSLQPVQRFKTRLNIAQCLYLDPEPG